MAPGSIHLFQRFIHLIPRLLSLLYEYRKSELRRSHSDPLGHPGQCWQMRYFRVSLPISLCLSRSALLKLRKAAAQGSFLLIYTLFLQCLNTVDDDEGGGDDDDDDRMALHDFMRDADARAPVQGNVVYTRHAAVFPPNDYLLSKTFCFMRNKTRLPNVPENTLA